MSYKLVAPKHIKDLWYLYRTGDGSYLWLVHQHIEKSVRKPIDYYVTEYRDDKLVCAKCFVPVPREIEDVGMLARVEGPDE